MPIRIVHVITSLISGGAETSLLRLLSHYDREKFPSTVIALDGDGAIAHRIQSLGVEVVDLKMRRGRIPSPIALLALVRHLRRLRPGLVQSWMYHADLMATLAVPLARGPKLLWNVRCSELNVGPGPTQPRSLVRLLAALSRRPTAVIVNSHAGLQYHASCGYRPQRWEVIPNGFDLEQFRVDLAARAAIRAELGLWSEVPLIGLVARWDPIKDHRMFFEAARLLLRQLPDVQFLLAGENMTVSNPTLSGWIEELGLLDHIHLLGERSDIPRVTAALDIASLTSFAEGFPNVVGEAMSCAVPCVVTDVGDVRWMVGDTGRVLDARDPAALAAAWCDVLALPANERAALGMRARNRINELLTIGKAIASYESLYETVGVPSNA